MGTLVTQARRIVVSGRVQGVGFRPFIYHHASEHQLQGWVRNITGRVEIQVQGEPARIDAFVDSLVQQAPPIASPVIESNEACGVFDARDFRILDSEADAEASIHLPADLHTCDECLAELDDSDDRRFRYPFINCTQCGPRYTLIRDLPYDRANTSMAGFALCEQCEREYRDVADRRYHAEPVACEDCGPGLRFEQLAGDTVDGNEPALQACIRALQDGAIVAIKGIGGYHLVCDACNDAAVDSLRQHKPRPHKPLAVMFSPEQLDTYTLVTPNELDSLQSAARPIVLVHKREPASHPLSPGIAPGMDSIGAMLPYSPLHALLLQDFAGPLVMTSANISGEPVLTDNEDVSQRLAHLVSACLHHNRPIVRPADDSVVRVIADKPRPIRLGRGLAPLELELPFRLQQPMLGVGCHMKNTIALAWDQRLVISPHIGEMGSLRSMQVFERCIQDLQAIYRVDADIIACDAHPGYGSSRWARSQSQPLVEVLHHHAHAGVAWYEASRQLEALKQCQVFTWDGVGLGPDGSLWGGETLLGQPGQWQRVACLRPFRLPGGERAGREPWRSAAALCWELGQDCPLPQAQQPLLQQFWQQGNNAPTTTAVGRLFDAAAALAGVCSEASFEGQGPMWLEALADPAAPVIDLPLITDNGLLQIDWSPLVTLMQGRDLPLAQRAGSLHRSLARAALQVAQHNRAQTGINVVALCGGVFQNRLLTEQLIDSLQDDGFIAVLPASIPVNDAGIAAGQVIEAHAMTLQEH